ncbi:MAG: DUF2335 domain-containing protein [Candidatus Aminicenantes bacterium]|nr:DUF2335 domain-containing protein [Candidatus Aminicenantes bacterium]
MKKSKKLKKSEDKKIEKSTTEDIDLEKDEFSQIGIESVIQKINTPFLPPNYLEKYNKVYTGFAKEICDSTILTIQHQIDSEKKFIDKQNKKTLRGQVFGVLVALTSIIAAVICVFKGAFTVAGILAGGSAVPHIITQLISTKKPEKKESNKEEESK